MPAEAYVLISTFMGAVLGFLSSMFTMRVQFKQETQKLERQAEKEKVDRLMGKLESAHQLLSKIAAGSASKSSDTIMKEEQVAEWQKGITENVRTVQMILDLYFPQLHGAANEICDKTAEMIDARHSLARLESQRSNEEATRKREQISELSSNVSKLVADAKQRLREVAGSLPGATA